MCIGKFGDYMYRKLASSPVIRNHSQGSFVDVPTSVGNLLVVQFAKVPRGPDRELVIGINRKGVLGFTLQEKPAGD